MSPCRAVGNGAHVRGLDPRAYPGPGAVLAQVAGDGTEGDARAPEHVGDLGHRALPAVGEPSAGVEGGMVHGLGRLHVDHQDQRVRLLGDGRHH
jgi:hypothetical protein